MEFKLCASKQKGAYLNNFIDNSLNTANLRYLFRQPESNQPIIQTLLQEKRI